jgi:hypothetical protein
MRPLHFASLLAAVLLTPACGLLDTNQPDTVSPGDLNTPEGAQSRRLGAISQFTFAKDGDGINTDGEILLTGLMADEFIFATTPPSEQEIDQRGATVLNPNIDAQYLALHRARTSAEDAAEALLKYSLDGDSDPGIPEMLALAGFTYVYFAEDFCPAVPYSKSVNGKITYGTSVSRDSSLKIAIARFDTALAAPGLTPEVDALARIGKARAYLNMDSARVADTIVATVASDFAYVTEHAESPARLQNQPFVFGRDGLWSVANLEGGNGFGFRDVQDPRVPYDSTGTTGLDTQTELFSLLKYPDASTSIPVADGIEARLIQAEAQLRLNAFAAMNGILNTLRATIGLGNLPVPGNAAAARTQLFNERALWLYATGHRLGDLRRLVRQYGLAVNTVFPEGNYHKSGGVYSNQVSLIIPQSVENNPNYNPADCDPTAP